MFLQQRSHVIIILRLDIQNGKQVLLLLHGAVHF